MWFSRDVTKAPLGYRRWTNVIDVTDVLAILCTPPRPNWWSMFNRILTSAVKRLTHLGPGTGVGNASLTSVLMFTLGVLLSPPVFNCKKVDQII
jgi:hypothetical protein